MCSTVMPRRRSTLWRTNQPAGGALALNPRSFGDAVALKMAALYSKTAVVVGAGLIGCAAAACLAGRGVATTLVAPEAVPLQRRLGIEVGERVAKILSGNGVRFVGPATVSAVDDFGVVLSTGHRRRTRRSGDRSPARHRPRLLGQGAGIHLHHRRIHAEIPRLGHRLRRRPVRRAPQRLHCLVRIGRRGRRQAHLRYNQSRRLNIQYSPATHSTMIAVLATHPQNVLMPGYSTFWP